MGDLFFDRLRAVLERPELAFVAAIAPPAAPSAPPPSPSLGIAIGTRDVCPLAIFAARPGLVWLTGFHVRLQFAAMRNFMGLLPKIGLAANAGYFAGLWRGCAIASLPTTGAAATPMVAWHALRSKTALARVVAAATPPPSPSPSAGIRLLGIV